jgi:glucarate dehydratase
MKIESIEGIPVTIPGRAPILTSYGSLKSWSRTIIKITTDNGLVGWGDVSSRIKPETLKTFEGSLRGLSPWSTTTITQRIKNWNYYPWQKLEPIMAGIEMACLDLQGKAAQVPVYELLGGRVRNKIPVSGYLFYSHANPDGSEQVHTPGEMVAFAKRWTDRFGFATLKLKGGYFTPEADRDALFALRETFGKDMRLRLDPQGSWTPTTAIRIGRELDTIGMEYFEDPCIGIQAMATVRRAVATPLSTNMCITSFEEFGPGLTAGAVDIVLSDIWYWGGMRPTIELDRLCFATGLDIGIHSGTELGIGWAAIIHAGVAMPHCTLAADAMYTHLTDDVIVGDMLFPVNGEIAPPEGVGLGVEVDEAKLRKYSSLATSGAAEDRFLNPALADMARPGWYPSMPAW